MLPGPRSSRRHPSACDTGSADAGDVIASHVRNVRVNNRRRARNPDMPIPSCPFRVGGRPVANNPPPPRGPPPPRATHTSLNQAAEQTETVFRTGPSSHAWVCSTSIIFRSSSFFRSSSSAFSSNLIMSSRISGQLSPSKYLTHPAIIEWYHISSHDMPPAQLVRWCGAGCCTG